MGAPSFSGRGWVEGGGGRIGQRHEYVVRFQWIQPVLGGGG